MNNKNLLIAGAAVAVVLIAALLFFLLGGKGDYKEGTYFGKSNLHTAVVYVNEDGMIKSVFIDSAYVEYASGVCKTTEVSYGTTKCIGTTKQILGTDYAMKEASEIKKEWYEQANTFAEKVVKEQDLEWLTIKKDGSTDSVSGVTVHVTDFAKAVEDALKKASK